MITILIKTLISKIYELIDVILYVLGFGCIVGALFLWSTIAGFVGLGLSLILTGLIIDCLPKKSQKK